MEEIILKNVLNYGIFPVISVYLMFIIIKDFKSEIKSIKNNNDENIKLTLSQFNNITSSLERLIDINENTQSYLTNYLNVLLIKLLDVLDDYDKK